MAIYSVGTACCCVWSGKINFVYMIVCVCKVKRVCMSKYAYLLSH